MEYDSQTPPMIDLAFLTAIVNPSDKESFSTYIKCSLLLKPKTTASPIAHIASQLAIMPRPSQCHLGRRSYPACWLLARSHPFRRSMGCSITVYGRGMLRPPKLSSGLISLRATLTSYLSNIISLLCRFATPADCL